MYVIYPQYCCLYVPAIPPGGLPVIVYIYGGGFIAGSASQPLYDGVNLASSQNVIVVTVNYRLGALGTC